MLKNYFFDFDKTLASSADTSIQATQQAYRENHLRIPQKNLILDQMGIPAEVSFPQMAAEDLDASAAQKLVAAYRRIYSRYEKGNTTLYPGINQVLALLKQRGKNLFVVSSKNAESLARNLTQLAIRSYFLDTIGCDQVAHYKPAPDGILVLLDRYQLKKAESVMIGDARYDLQMGKAAGVRTCGATWGAFDPESLKRERPDFLITQVKALLSLM